MKLLRRVLQQQADRLLRGRQEERTQEELHTCPVCWLLIEPMPDIGRGPGIPLALVLLGGAASGLQILFQEKVPVSRIHDRLRSGLSLSAGCQQRCAASQIAADAVITVHEEVLGI